MKAILSLLAAVSITATLQAQTTNSAALGSKTGSAGATTTQTTSQSLDDNGREVVSLGVGLGFDYCGIGVGATVYPLVFLLMAESLPQGRLIWSD